MIVNNQPSGKQGSKSGQRKEGSEAVVHEFPLFQAPYILSPESCKIGGWCL